jgi:transcriptional regulator of acetoin/glycerol metabolism
MVSVNCGSIPENLIESELFGYQRGAFSGALATGMKGKVVQAHGGTLFLDEIGDMPAAQQTRLLRVLSEREVTPIGAASAISVDLQLICATHQNIEARVAAGAFREDLYYRVAVGILHLPPLRERRDRGWLLDSIVSAEARGISAAEAIDAEAREIALAYSWPGNLRQMRSAIQYAWAVKSGECIRACDLPANVLSGVTIARSAQPFAPETRALGHAAQYESAVREAYAPGRGNTGERENIIRALTASRWNISAASRELGICRASLYRKLRQLQIPHVRDVGSDALFHLT